MPLGEMSRKFTGFPLCRSAYALLPFLVRIQSFNKNKNRHPNGCLLLFGCRTRIRTQTNRVRVCCATFTQSGNKKWCGRRGLNPYGCPHAPQTCASANSATLAQQLMLTKSTNNIIPSFFRFVNTFWEIF